MDTESLPALFENLTPKNLGLVGKPFNSQGDHKRCVVLIAFFLDNKPKKKLDILLDSGILKDKTKVNIGSYYASYFHTLSRMRVLRYDSLTKTWERGENYLTYLTYIIKCMLQTDAAEKVHSLLTPEQILRLENDLNGVVLELLQDKATRDTLRRIWRGDHDNVIDYILNLDDAE